MGEIGEDQTWTISIDRKRGVIEHPFGVALYTIDPITGAGTVAGIVGDDEAVRRWLEDGDRTGATAIYPMGNINEW